MCKKAKFTAILLTMVLLMTMFPVSPTFAQAKENSDLSILDFSSQLNGLVEEYDEPYFEEITLSTEETKQLSEIISENDTSFENALATSEAENPNDVEAQEPTTFKAKRAFSKAQIEKEKEEAAVAESIVTQSASDEGFAVEKSSDGSLTVSKPFQTKRIIVKSDKKPVDDKAIAVVGGYHDIYVLQYETEEEAEIALSELSARKDIDFAQADGVVSACDSYLSWGYGENYMNQSNYLSWLGSSKPDLEEVTVAVIDTGVAYDHEFLAGRVDTENDYDFVNDDADAYDDHSHGTHVAGTIAEGTKSNVKILPIKCLAGIGYGLDTQIYLGICYAVQKNVDVINMSLGGRGKSSLLEEAINDATEKGIIVCVAAGNEGENAEDHKPANVESAITVAAVDRGMKLASFSNYGDCVDLAAPGVGINSCIPYNKNDESAKKYELFDGTSMATPHVAAACAALKSYDKSITTADALNYFSQTSLKVNTNQGVGMGLICMTDILSTDASKLSLGDVSVPMFPGQQYTVKGVTIPQADITWSSSDESIASVSGGTVSAKKNGRCVITAQANGQTRECEITVSELSVSIHTKPFTMYVGFDADISYSVSHKAEVRLYSSDENVFQVSDTGKVTAIGFGQAQLVAVAGENTISEVKKSITITVKDIGDWYDRNKSEYIIENAEQLYELSVLTYRKQDFYGKTVTISDTAKEIDLSVFPEWLPIGTGWSFNGTFDGNNVPIVGMHTDNDVKDAALFAETNWATIKNVVISEADINASGKAAGVVVVSCDSFIYNCRVDGAITSVHNGGGICAEMYRTIVVNCENRACVQSWYAGGITAVSISNSLISNCINYGDINAKLSCGITYVASSRGSYIIGVASSDTGILRSEKNAIINCVNVGKAKRGIVNYIEGSEISRCYYLDSASASGYRELNYYESDTGYSYGMPQIYSFSDDLVAENGMSVISSLNSYVYYANQDRDAMSLYTWKIDNNLPAFTFGTATEQPAFWLPDCEDKLIYTGDEFKAEVLSNIDNPSVSWKSSDPSIASVSSDGTVTGISCGSAEITAVCPEGRINLSYHIEVIDGQWYQNTEDNYCITSAQELYEFSKLINLGVDNFEGKYVYLKKDIDLSAFKNWEPIGYANAELHFAGTFDGKNNRISHLNFSDRPCPSGLFGTIDSGAIIENLILDDVNIAAFQCFCNGTLCARMNEGSIVRNCVTGKGIIKCGTTLTFYQGTGLGGVSGLVGRNDGGLIENCVNNASCISTGASAKAAGICAHGYGNINNCVNNGMISGFRKKVAGIVANPYVKTKTGNSGFIDCYPIISNCTNNGEIQTMGDSASGITASNSGKIVNCLNNGTISNSGSARNAVCSGINNADSYMNSEYCMDNVVNEGSVIDGGSNYAIGRIAQDNTFRMYYLDSSSSEAALFTEEAAAEELYPYASDRMLANGQALVDVLNANVDEHNEKETDVKYLPWYIDSDNHLRIGDECQHERIDYVYSKCPGCESDGERRLQCLGCGKPFSDTETVSATGHTVPDGYTWVWASTCSENGHKYKHCLVCEKVLDEFTVDLPLLPHTESEEYYIRRQPTCSKPGSKYKKCTVCDKLLSNTFVEVPTLPHTESEEYYVFREPTCCIEGIRAKKCLVCGGKISDTATDIPKVPHQSDEGVITDYPTCIKTGTKVYRCTVCNVVMKTETLKITDHNRGPDGNCTVCGIELANDCTCNCHKSGFIGFIWKIQRFFYKLFRINQTCTCGELHY